MLDSAVFDTAMAEISDRSRNRLYRTDFLAWSSDVLGRRYYSKMNEIATAITTPTNGKIRTAVKSSNGAGKSFILSDIQTWWVSAFPADEALAITSANGRDQIERVVYKMLKDNWGYMASQHKLGKGPAPLGWISEKLEWNYDKPDGSGKGTVAFGKRPADQDIVSSFQGTRKRRTFVGFDEMGGLPEDLFTAAEAVLTGDESRFAGIGNPDRRATPFHRLFTDSRQADEWNLFTISAYDLPTMTGEIVYPNDSQKQEAMMKGLTSRRWIEHKERAWRSSTGKPDARFLAKVLGEFPGETDNSFFPEDDVTLSHETNIDIAGTSTVIGVDLAAMGEDESVVYVNRGGHIRLFDKSIKYDDGGNERKTTGVWAKEDEVTSARRIHAIATYLGATEVRVDAAGLGGGVATMLYRLDEFNNKCYVVVRSVGSEMSADRNKWHNARAQNNDNLKSLMHEGLIDLDPDDTHLSDELLIITYDFDKRRAVQITSKYDMKGALGGSPDRLDAVINAALDTSPLVNDPNGHLNKGDHVNMDPWDVMDSERGGPGYPM